MKYFYIIVFLFCSASIFAQTEIKGVITSNEDGKALAGISVTIQEKNSSGMISYAITNDKGSYKLNFNSSSDSVIINFSGFNIKKESQVIRNRTQEFNFKLSSQDISLKEVRITPPKIRQIGDTLNYNVDGYVDANDRSIGDVLKKMPGIEVKESGQILVNDKPINKLYVENMDLLQGRYGIATNNIRAKDVATVQVLENHQPIKALKDKLHSEDAAINLKLKDSAKGTLIANGALGIGGPDPVLWNNELYSMYFAKGRQNVNTYKGNNTGDDVSRELTSFYTLDMSSLNSDNWLSVQSPSAPSISQKRYLSNRANTLSVNNLWTLKNEYQLNANFSYLNDRQEKNSYSRSSYYLPGDSLLTIEETMSSKAHVNQAEAEVQLSKNASKFYLSNLLKFSGKWNNADGNVLGTADTISQHLDNPSYKLTNTFRLTLNTSNSTIDISSSNGYTRTPHSLTINPVLYSDLFDQSQNWSGMQQDLTLGNFQSNNSVSWQLQTGRWKQNYRAGFTANIEHLESELLPEFLGRKHSVAPDSLQNDLQYNRYQWSFSPTYIYELYKFRASIGLPLNYVLLHINDRILSDKQDHSKLLFNPNLSLRYEFNAYWTANAMASYGNSLGGLSNSYSGYVMRSYRTLLSNDGDLLERKTQNYSINIDYRNPIHALFGGMRVSHSNTKSNLLFGTEYQGILSVRQTWAIPTHTEGYTVTGSMSKGIDAIASTVRLGGSYSNSKSVQLTQNELFRYRSNTYSISPEISTKLRSWGSLSYRFSFAESRNKVQNSINNFKPIRTTTQSARLNLFPTKGLRFNVDYEYFYNSAIASGDRTMSFLDAGSTYKWKDIEFNLSYTNILNTKQYISASYSDISTYYSTFDLRPAEILLKVRFKIKGK